MAKIVARAPRKKTGRPSESALALMHLGRDMGTAGLMFHQAIAERLGLNTTDHKCLDLLHRHENATAGDLAEWTGLTTGAATGIIDRLERAGFVRREPHPTDRRKVVVRAVCERLPEVGRLFEPLAAGMAELAGHYSEAELRVIMDYMTRVTELFRRETRRVSEEPGARG